MTKALDLNKVSTLSNELLTNLDERVFFSKLGGFIQDTFNEYKVQVFQAYEDGASELIVENDNQAKNEISYNKGQGLSGYVIRTKRAYYSNSKSDPLLATTQRDECVIAELCVPVISNGSVIATIHVQSNKEDRKFNEEDVSMILDILDNVSSPINNIRLYLIAKNLNKELEKKIKMKEEELLNRGPALANKTSTVTKVEMIGQTNAFVEVMNMAKKIAKEDFPVMICGESGTGKKLLAKKIHTLSLRNERECITVHCSALSEEQLELELFGNAQRQGVIQRANGGTLILDGVEALSPQTQDKILRLIVSGELYTLDSNIPSTVSVRIVSITKSDLRARVEEGLFREELLYRLNIMNINMPSLKERKDDIKLLSEYFLNKAQRDGGKIITTKAIEKLSSYNWPGNIHELKNLMERTAILVSEQFIDESHLPNLEVEEEVEEVIVEEFSEMSLHDLEKMHICKTLDHLGGNKTRAAKSLGITVKTLYNKLHSYGLVHQKAE